MSIYTDYNDYIIFESDSEYYHYELSYDKIICLNNKNIININVSFNNKISKKDFDYLILLFSKKKTVPDFIHIIFNYKNFNKYIKKENKYYKFNFIYNNEIINSCYYKYNYYCNITDIIFKVMFLKISNKEFRDLKLKELFS